MMLPAKPYKAQPALRRAATQIFIVAVCLLCVGIFSAPGQERAKVNIILLTVDTLRADRLSGYGYDRRTSPAIDALMNEGIRFEDATTTIPLTNPSFTSVMTSRYAHETGATRNGLPMDADFITLAEILKKHGYRTGAIISNWTLKSEVCALHKGFDYYHEKLESKRSIVVGEQDARDVTDLALDWLDRRDRSRPFFAWVHYSDPHAPYEMRKNFRFKLRSGEKKKSPSYRYDTEVAYTDFHIGRFLKGLESRGIKKNTFIFFFSDHGESLGEHGYTGHGRQVYQPMMRVPMAIIGPGIRRGVVARTPVTLLDVMPTVLSYAGLPIPKGIRGVNLIAPDGGPVRNSHGVRYFETYRGAVPDVAGAKKVLPGAKPLRLGTQEGKWKLIHSPEHDRRELYDLSVDPLELHDVSSNHIERTAVMTRKAWEWFHATRPANPPRPRMIPPDVREKLKALGYIE